jgi:formate/nitrite transporter
MEQSAPYLTSPVDAHTPQASLQLTEQAGIAKVHLSWLDLIIKSFLGGLFISLGAAFDLVLVGGAPGLRSSNPALTTFIGAFVFPIGFVIITLTNMELCTSNMFVMAYSTLRRKTTLYDLARNLVTSYIFSVAGALFYAEILCWWTDTLSMDAQSAYVVTKAEGRVDVNWIYNVTRGIMCNWLVDLAFFLGTQGRDNTSKIYGIWIVIWAFTAMRYQYSIANYFLVSIGMFYGTRFGVRKFIWASCIPVTLGNIIGVLSLGLVRCGWCVGGMRHWYGNCRKGQATLIGFICYHQEWSYQVTGTLYQLLICMRARAIRSSQKG